MGEGNFTSVITTITDANVNGGVALSLQGASITKNTEVFSQVPDIAYGTLTGTYDSRLAEGRYSGFGNPKLTITGNYYLGEDVSNKLTAAFMKDLVSSAVVKTLTSDLTGTIKVVIKGVSESNTYAQTVNGVVNYSMALLQVKDV